MGYVKVKHVVLVVARQKEYRRGPAMQRRKTRQAKVAVIELRPGLVGANIARQHQHVSAGCGLGREVRVRLQVQVRKELDFHRADCA